MDRDGPDDGRWPFVGRGMAVVMRARLSALIGRPAHGLPRGRGVLPVMASVVALLIWLVPELAPDPVQAAQPKESGPSKDAGPIKDIVGIGAEAQQQALASQHRIDKTVQEATELAARYKNILKEIDNLKSYNDQLERQIANQRAEMVALASSADRVVKMERQLVPLMARMLDSLTQFVELDLPFHIIERRARLARLKALLDRPDAAVSEKFRAVIAAYEAEAAYGHAFTSYDGSVAVNGKPQSVHYLQVGRVALLFQTRDGKVSGLWNPRTKGWDILDDRYAGGIAEGVRVARKQAPAEQLLPIPLRVPEKKQ